MKIMMLAKKPRKVIAFDVDKVDRLLNGYASPGTTVEVAFPDDFDGSQVEQALGRQMMLTASTTCSKPRPSSARSCGRRTTATTPWSRATPSIPASTATDSRWRSR